MEVRILVSRHGHSKVRNSSKGENRRVGHASRTVVRQRCRKASWETPARRGREPSRSTRALRKTTRPQLLTQRTDSFCDGDVLHICLGPSFELLEGPRSDATVESVTLLLRSSHEELNVLPKMSRQRRFLCATRPTPQRASPQKHALLVNMYL